MGNEDNPLLKFDAFTAGIEDGGLRSTTSIELIACYILATIEEKITADTIVEAMVTGKIANYFEISNAISKMLKNGQFIEDEEGYLIITEKCKEAIEWVEEDLPYTIRKRSIEIVRKLLIREVYKKETKATIEQVNDQYKITLHVSDNDRDFMVLSLFLPTEGQAELVRDEFQEHPTKVYETLMHSIFYEEPEE